MSLGLYEVSKQALGGWKATSEMQMLKVWGHPGPIGMAVMGSWVQSSGGAFPVSGGRRGGVS